MTYNRQINAVRHELDEPGRIGEVAYNPDRRRRSSVAEQPPCKRQVVCSIQTGGTNVHTLMPQGSFGVSVFSAGFGAGRGGGRSFASFRRGSRAMLSFTGGGGGLSTQWAHAKYARFANSTPRKTFRTDRF